MRLNEEKKKVRHNENIRDGGQCAYCYPVDAPVERSNKIRKSGSFVKGSFFGGSIRLAEKDGSVATRKGKARIRVITACMGVDWTMDPLRWQVSSCSLVSVKSSAQMTFPLSAAAAS
jgi:hypothetical protein